MGSQFWDLDFTQGASHDPGPGIFLAHDFQDMDGELGDFTMSEGHGHPLSSSHCPFPVELVTNRAGQGQGQGRAGKGRAGQGGQGSRCEGTARGAISIKEILGENRGTYI